MLVLSALLLSCGGNASMEGKYPGKNNGGQNQNPTEESKPVDGQTWRVLFIGNSLTLDATYFLPSLLNAAGVKNIELTRTFHGAYTMQGYNNNYAGSNICAWTTWKPGQARWRGEQTLTHSLKEVAEAEAYDIICLQEYTGDKAGWEYNTTEKIHVNGLIQKLRDSQKKKGNDNPRFVYLFSTQFGRGQDRLVANFNNDPTQQFATNSTFTAALLADNSIKTVISTGALQQNLRTTGLNTSRDMTRGDQVHMDYGHMRWAGASLIFKTLFTPITGIKIEDIPFGYDEYYPHKSLHSTPVTAENRPILLEAIQNAYDHPLQITDMSKYTLTETYTHKPGTVWLDENDVIEPVSWPVEWPVGDAVNDTYKQPYWSAYGIWFSKAQQQAYLKWNFASYAPIPVDNYCPTRTFATDKTNNIYSPSLRGLWTGDWFEFVIPVKDMPAGTKIRFTAPFYTRQGPVFWAFEWLDGDQWKNECTSITKDGFTRNASFALNLGTTNVSCTATFANALKEGKLRFRVRCVDGSIQADTSSGKAVERAQPNYSGSDYSSVFYFYDKAAPTNAIRFDIAQ